jgi:hypothetical protein
MLMCFFQPREVDDWSAGEAEGRNRVTDRLLGTWSRGMNRVTRCLELGLHLGRGLACSHRRSRIAAPRRLNLDQPMSFGGSVGWRLLQSSPYDLDQSPALPSRQSWISRDRSDSCGMLTGSSCSAS